MIESALQLKVTKEQIERFEEALGHTVTAPPDPNIHPRIRQAQMEALQSMLDELREEVHQYEAKR
jgi:hypothetical protein